MSIKEAGYHQESPASYAAFHDYNDGTHLLLLPARSLTKSVFTMNPFSNKRVALGITITIVLYLLIVYVIPLNRV